MQQSVYRLQMSGLPPVDSLQSLSRHTGLSESILYKLSATSAGFYRRFTIPKKSGGQREISAPSREMKAVQAWILRNILDPLHVHDSATGFRRHRNILLNARPHQSNRYLLCLDIDDFFPSISYGKIYNVFLTLGYSRHMAHVFASLCSCDEKLPQGAVTSPALSNLICYRLDRRISGFSGKRNIAYTRYADDMTFSSMNPNRLVGIKRMVQRILREEGFALNEGKTRYMGPRRQRRVTGLVISDNSVGVGRKRKRKLRASIHRLVAGKLATKDREALSRHLLGWSAFLLGVDPTGHGQLETYATRLCRKHGYKRPVVVPSGP